MTHTVEIMGFAFNPLSITISVGDSVQWVNRDAVKHSAKREEDPEFDTGRLSQNATSAPQLFDGASPAAGFDYFCEPHPHMVGTVVVVQAPGPDGIKCGQ